MATQRPAGVIKDNLRANTNLRIALRMADEADSEDVVGDADRRRPSTRRIPGRGIAKTGPGSADPVPVRATPAAGRTRRAGHRRRRGRRAAVRSARSGSRRPPECDAHDEDLGPTTRSGLVANLVVAASAALVRCPARDRGSTTCGRCVDIARPAAEPATDRSCFGVADIPERQQQDADLLPPDRDGNMRDLRHRRLGQVARLLQRSRSRPGIGRARSRSTSTASTSAPGRCDARASPARRLDHRRRRRRAHQRLLRSPGGDRPPRGAVRQGRGRELTEYREIADQPDEPRILLLIDGYPEFQQEWEIAAGARAVLPRPSCGSSARAARSASTR